MKNILLVFLVLFLFSCKTEPNYREIGQELCTCMKPMLELTNQITAMASDATNKEAVEKMVKDLEALNTKTEKCVTDLGIQYPELEVDNPKAEAAFKESCPEIAAFLDQ